MINNDYFDNLSKVGINLSEEQKQNFIKDIEAKLNRPTTVGFFGKTGVGKSSLCNAMFGRDICEISNVGACTREPQKVVLELGQNNLTLLDVPGVGESAERDEEYAKLYNKLIPELDLVVWILKGDDRAFASDLLFYNKMLKQYFDEGKPFLFVLNQVDKIDPIRDWNEQEHTPGAKQEQNIQAKVNYVAEVFGICPQQIIPISAEESFNLNTLLDEMVCAIPAEKSFTIAKSLNPCFSEKAKEITETTAIVVISSTVEEHVPEEQKTKALQIVETITNFAINGNSTMHISSATQLANEYMRDSKYASIDKAVDALIKWETSKNAMLGFVTNVGGIVTIPVTLPADMLASWIYQARMAAAIAYMYGHDVNEDRVKTFVVATLCGNSVNEILKSVGIKVANSYGKKMVARIPAEVLKAINKKLGINLISKAGQKSITSLTKMIPILGGLIGAGMDAAYCRSVGKRAKSLFSTINFE